MRRSAEIIGLPLFLIEEGKEVGKVKDIIIDRSASKVTAFLIEDPSWPKLKILPFSDIRSLGVDALVIDSQDLLVDFQEGATNKKLAGKSAQIAEYKFDAHNGKLLDYKPKKKQSSQYKPKKTTVKKKAKVKQQSKNDADKPKYPNVFATSYLFIPLLIVAGAAIVYRKVILMKIAGPGWDVFAFLANAMQFAGKGFGYSEPHRPPFLPLLTSFVFRAGFTSEASIFIVDGVLFVIGVIGLYLLLKRRFSPFLSFLGSVFYLSTISIIGQVAIGMSDLPSVSISIWAFLLLMHAIEKDSTYYWIAFPVLTAAFLTRFAAILMLSPIFILFINKANILRDIKKIIQGFVVSVIALIPYFVYNYKIFGDIFYPIKAALGGATTLVSEIGGTPTKGTKIWYLKNLPTLITAPKFQIIAVLLILISAIGLLMYLIKNFSRHKSNKITVFIVSLCTISLYIALFLLADTEIRQIYIVAMGLLLCLSLNVKRDDQKNLLFDVSMLCWFLAYFDFYSHFEGLDRYFISMVPALSYFVLIAIEGLTQLTPGKVYRNISGAIASLLIIVTATASISTFWKQTAQASQMKQIPVSPVKKTAQWLKAYDKDLGKKKIYSDSWVDLSWYLRQKVEAMPFFKDGRALEHELQKYNIDYYVPNALRNFESYKLLTEKYGYPVYQKVPENFMKKPRVLYIGKNWEHYVEDVTNFNYFVIYEGGIYGAGDSIYIDHHSLSELKQYPLILLYNFKWHNRAEAESLLKNYVQAGGKIIIDATGNIGDNPRFNLNGDNFFGILITSKALTANPNTWIDKSLSKEPIGFAPFLSDGEQWNGASYKAIVGKNSLEQLATVNGDTLIARQRIGKGEVYWIAYNFLWHSFYSEKKSEQKLIQNLFDLSLYSGNGW